MYPDTEIETKGSRKSLMRRLYRLLIYQSGALRFGRRLWPNSLTVVNYHRIEDISRTGLDSFKPNISATPDAFDQQMAYLKRWLHVISIDELTDWLKGGRKLPPHAALITFDDGYLDNYVHAYPVLRQHSLPALIFLTTGHIASDAPFYWDLAAYCFQHTKMNSVVFPNGQEQRWSSEAERDTVSHAWIESLKALKQEEKREIVNRLPEQLGVIIPEGTFRKLMLNWDLVREMYAGGIRFGGHTVNHPILTRIPLDAAREEVLSCKQRIEKETGAPVRSFAYPNGMQADWNREIEGAVRAAGYEAAFTLESGPATLKEVRKDPLAIRRIFISHRHSIEHFAAMLTPLNRLRGS
jgi:peptidoglycan/xylan/chitin deacetylase (PgdA/CDA1 family)